MAKLVTEYAIAAAIAAYACLIVGMSKALKYLTRRTPKQSEKKDR